MAKRYSAKQKNKLVKKNVIGNASKEQQVDNGFGIAASLQNPQEPCAIEVIASSEEMSSGIGEGSVEPLALVKGVLDWFTAPNIFGGWTYQEEGCDLGVRIIVNGSILGEALANRKRGDLMSLNKGHVGWQLDADCQFSAQEFVALADNIKVVVLDTGGNVIGQIPIWDKLLEKLMNGQ